MAAPSTTRDDGTTVLHAGLEAEILRPITIAKKCIGSMAGTENFEMDDFAKLFHPHVGGGG